MSTRDGGYHILPGYDLILDRGRDAFPLEARSRPSISLPVTRIISAQRQSHSALDFGVLPQGYPPLLYVRIRTRGSLLISSLWVRPYMNVPDDLRDAPDSHDRPETLDSLAMRQCASQQAKQSSPVAPVNSEENRSLQGGVRRPRRGSRVGPRDSFVHVSGGLTQDTPFGAIHVDASGIVLEHRLVDTGEFSAPPRSIVGRNVKSIAPWAGEPSFMSALNAAIDNTKASFHFDFKTSAAPVERVVHVNLLAVGDKTAWVFISDKTLAMVSS